MYACARKSLLISIKLNWVVRQISGAMQLTNLGVCSKSESTWSLGNKSVRRITKTSLILTPLNPTFITIVKLGFTGVYTIFFLFLLKIIDCGYSLEPPQIFSENFHFLWWLKCSVYLNRLVFVICSSFQKMLQVDK